MSSPRILSSAQWFTLLDELLLEAVHTMLDSTMIVEHYVSQLANYQLSHKKRHVGHGAWQQNIGRMICFIVDPRIERFAEINFDRSYVYAMLRSFIELMQGYEREFERSFRHGVTANLLTYHTRVGAKCDLLQTQRSVITLYEAAISVKHRIIGQYERYMQATSVYDAKHHPLISNSGDLYQSYYLAANRAVDHFDLDKGAFKTYLDFWITKYRNGDHHHYGSAYSVPNGASANHLYVPLDGIEVGIEGSGDVVNNMDELQHMMQLIALVDPGGYAAQALDIGEQV